MPGPVNLCQPAYDAALGQLCRRLEYYHRSERGQIDMPWEILRQITCDAIDAALNAMTPIPIATLPAPEAVREELDTEDACRTPEQLLALEAAARAWLSSADAGVTEEMVEAGTKAYWEVAERGDEDEDIPAFVRKATRASLTAAFSSAQAGGPTPTDDEFDYVSPPLKTTRLGSVISDERLVEIKAEAHRVGAEMMREHIAQWHEERASLAIESGGQGESREEYMHSYAAKVVRKMSLPTMPEGGKT